MHGIVVALYFLTAPPQSLLELKGQVVALNGETILRWQSSGQARIFFGNRLLADFASPASVVADFQDSGFLRFWMNPNVADNGLVYPQDAHEIFVNGRKVSCRFEGPLRRLFYPNLQNREPCER